MSIIFDLNVNTIRVERNLRSKHHKEEAHRFKQPTSKNIQNKYHSIYSNQNCRDNADGLYLDER